MNIKKTILVCALVGLISGCARPIGHPPYSVREYDALLASNPHGYTKHTILQANIQRVLDNRLRESQRIESMRLVEKLANGNSQVSGMIAILVKDETCPPALRQQVQAFLIRQGLAAADVDIPKTPATEVASAEPSPAEPTTVKPAPEIVAPSQLTPAPESKTPSVLDRFNGKTSAKVLSDVVILWAEESVDGQQENDFRRLVERITGSKWDNALLEALNAQDFYARGSAIQVLSARVPQTIVIDRLANMTAKTPAIEAMQVFASKFGYVPSTRQELLSCVLLHRTAPELLDDAARLHAEWKRRYLYQFKTRDLHLLSRLGGDPVREKLTRTELMLRLASAFGKRSHPDTAVTDFRKQADSLTVADLWNLFLLNEMLEKEQIDKALAIVADQIRREPASPRGGLVFYENGQANAKLYPDAEGDTGDDMDYRPSKTLVRAGRDAMCRFQVRFKRVYDSSKAFATTEDILRANEDNAYGLILTTVDENHFSAVYYKPSGTMVSLGLFPLNP